MEDPKDYIINIRVSKEVYDKLQTKAKENSESLSGLVRKTINDSMEIFGDITDELFSKNKGGKNDFAHYQRVILAKDTPCDRCHTVIPKGSHVLVGETGSGEKKYFCGACFADN
jgi:formamidopyrimidine-DNA glycosylase